MVLEGVRSRATRVGCWTHRTGMGPGGEAGGCPGCWRGPILPSDDQVFVVILLIWNLEEMVVAILVLKIFPRPAIEIITQ